RPQPYSLAVGMGFTLLGLLLLAGAESFPLLLVAAALVGIGSSVFHPESSRVARLASGGRHGFAQSFFQVGGNTGSSLGPLVAAFLVVPRGRSSIAWFSVAALLGILVLSNVGRWYRRHLGETGATPPTLRADRRPSLSAGQVRLALAVLIALIFSKYFYL